MSLLVSFRFRSSKRGSENPANFGIGTPAQKGSPANGTGHAFTAAQYSQESPKNNRLFGFLVSRKRSEFPGFQPLAVASVG
jgi:hypothetical protein